MGTIGCRVTVALLSVVGLTSGFRQAEWKLAVGIVGGNVTDITKVPYQAAALHPEGGNFFCGASIITKRHLLLAAHCCHNYRKINFRVGSSDWTQGGTVIHSNRVVIHPKYNSTYYYPDYDVCIVQTTKSIKFGRKIRPLMIAKNLPQADDMVMVAGWGVTETGNLSNVLRSVWVPVTNSTYCQKAYPFITDMNRFICAGVAGKDNCYGDSGGALTWKRKLVGIVSFGKGCGEKGYPGVYANALSPEIRKFIRNVAGV